MHNYILYIYNYIYMNDLCWSENGSYTLQMRNLYGETICVFET